MSWTTARPCGRCGKTDRCSVATTGHAICRTAAAWQPDDRIKADHAGEEYAVLASEGGGVAPDPSPDVYQFPLADAATRHRVLGAVLERFRPVAATLAPLYRRGFTPEDVARLEYARAPDDDRAALDLERALGRDALCGTPGFWLGGGDGVHLLTPKGGQCAVPARHVDGNLAALRIRTDDPDRKWVWWSFPAAAGVLRPAFAPIAHVPLHAPAMRDGTVILTEGELKADLVTLRTGVLCVSIPGVSQWRRVLDVLAPLGARRVVLAFDGDARRKKGVAGALQRCAAALAAAGYEVAVAVWPDSAGKGIDDVVVNPDAGPWAIELHEGPDAWAKVGELAAAAGAPPDALVAVRSVLAGLEARAAADVKAAYAPEALAALVALRRHAPAEFAALKVRLAPALAGQVNEWKAALKDVERRLTRERRAAAEAALRRARAALPEVLVDTDEQRVADETITAIGARAENVYQRGPMLVQIARGVERKDGVRRATAAPMILEMKLPIVREACSASARFLEDQVDHDGVTRRVEVHPPPWLYQAIHARGSWPPAIRPLLAVVEVPVLRADGTIIDVSGYDGTTEVYLAPLGPLPEVPDRPTRADATAAVAALYDVVCDFPFAADAHRTVWLAWVLTLLSRFAYDGPAPFFLIDKNLRGAGSGLLTDTIALIGTGRPAARASYTSDEDEMRKRITSIALAGDPLVVLDNITQPVDSAELNKAVTTTSWADRLLGGNDYRKIPLYATWGGNGNNVALGSDTTRRTARARLESTHEKPEERTGFAHDDLLEHVRTHRTRLLGAALTILRAYFAAGRPKQKVVPWGGFEGWAAVVPSALVWAGEPDIGVTRQELTTQADQSANVLEMLLDGLREFDRPGHGVTVRHMLDQLADPALKDSFQALRTALDELAGASKNPAKTIGNKLDHYRGRPKGGWALDSKSGRLGALWLVRKLDVAPKATDDTGRDAGRDAARRGTCGTCGTNSPQRRTEETSFFTDELEKQRVRDKDKGENGTAGTAGTADLPSAKVVRSIQAAHKTVVPADPPPPEDPTAPVTASNGRKVVAEL